MRCFFLAVVAFLAVSFAVVVATVVVAIVIVAAVAAVSGVATTDYWTVGQPAGEGRSAICALLTTCFHWLDFSGPTASFEVDD